VLKLRKVELFGFKSFCEKTPITFSGTGVTCIVGPNGCGKSNVVDAISWVLGEQSHKMLRAERMSDCIFNGTAKRPPLGLAEVTLTLVDPELSEAVARVIDPDPQPSAEAAAAASAETPPTGEEIPSEERKPWKKRSAEKPAIHLRPGEVVVGRRLYRSGESEYLINGRVARLRDVQEIFMGIGLGPDSYAIIEQGRIGQVLNSKPMDRRAIIEEAAGITMYKTKRRLAEAKLEASKANLSRVNDILVEVEKQLASLKRQASKARRFAQLREEMRGLLRIVLASKAGLLDAEAARLEALLREMEQAEARQSRSVEELEAEQERLSARAYSLDAELRQTQNLLNQTALDLDRAENRIAFNREQTTQLASREGGLSTEIDQAERQASELAARATAEGESVAALRVLARSLEAGLREAGERVSASAADQASLEARVGELRRLAAGLIEQAAEAQAESLQAEEASARLSALEVERAASLRTIEQEYLNLAASVESADTGFAQSEQRARELASAARHGQSNLASLRQLHQETAQQLERARQALSAERARHASIEQILRERAYTADAVQKLFNASGEGHSSGFRALGLLADFAEVPERYEAAIEQFLRDELEYIVVQSFDQARTGVRLLRDEMGGRATFFVDSLPSLPIDPSQIDYGSSMPGDFIERLDRLVEFRQPLGPNTKYFLKKLRTAYLVETPAGAERMALDNPHSYFLTPEGTCYHGRMVSGGRKSEAGPLALKRELRQREAETARLEALVGTGESALEQLQREITLAESQLARLTAEHVEAEKALVSALHQREQARREFARIEQRVVAEREEISRLRAGAEAARIRADQARAEHAERTRTRGRTEAEAAQGAETLAGLRRDFQVLQEQVVARREELAAMAERLAGAEATEGRLRAEATRAVERMAGLHQHQQALARERAEIDSSSRQLAQQVDELGRERDRLSDQKASLETEWTEARLRSGQIDESLRGRRQSLDELRAERGQRQIERARNDSDRAYLRQTCVSELNAQPEELLAEHPQLVPADELASAEANYTEMKARHEQMGPVNMMALEEFQECEQRETFLRRERDDLVQSIENTQLTINELDEVSRKKFEDAFHSINAHFAVAFRSLFGGGHGEMRLSEPDSSGESGIDIVAQPPGKRLQNVFLLSGGEKALTALALLIAVFRYQPSPFCILDEVDAPLDEANVGRFSKMLADMCGQTQFIVVTHNRKTMEIGSVLYGVTMQEPGVSKLVSVKWEEVAAAPTQAASTSNAA
jgi:chromosome segregation protein